jgi:hypothetical protein
MTPDEDDLIAGALHLIMAGSGGLWWIDDPDGVNTGGRPDESANDYA